MNKEMKCLRCDANMVCVDTHTRLQLGKSGILTGNWSNVLSGALEVEIYRCDGCGKIEFFSVDVTAMESKITQVSCPYCKYLHDLDDVKCPCCHKKF